MNSWTQLLLGVLALAGSLLAAARWMVGQLDMRLRASEDRVLAALRAELGSTRDGLRAEMADGFGELRTHAEVTNHRLGALEADMLLVKQRLIGSPATGAAG